MTKSKQFKTRVGGKTWRMREATLYLNDWSQGGGYGGYNHPVISMEFAAPDKDYPGEDTIVRVGISFQRNVPGGYGAKAITGLMDTAQSWCAAYGGHMELDRENTRLDLGRTIAKPSMADRLREKISILLDAAITDYNLRSVSDCQCEQVYLAIQALGGDVDQQYAMGNSENGQARYMSRGYASKEGVRFGANDRIRLNIDQPEGAPLGW